MITRKILLIFAGFCVLSIACAGGWLFYEGLNHEMLTPWPGCRQSDSPCIESAAKRFHEVDYAEEKDLAKTFLTLLVGVFVASVTFTEKIIDIKTAHRISVLSMMCCWLFLLAAIAMCGGGLSYATIALYQAMYMREAPFQLENWAGWMFILSGGVFVLALVAMFIAALPSLFPVKPIPQVEQEISLPQDAAPEAAD